MAVCNQEQYDFRIPHINLCSSGQISVKPDQGAPFSTSTWRSLAGVGRVLSKIALHDGSTHRKSLADAGRVSRRTAYPALVCTPPWHGQVVLAIGRRRNYSAFSMESKLRKSVGCGAFQPRGPASRVGQWWPEANKDWADFSRRWFLVVPNRVRAGRHPGLGYGGCCILVCEAAAVEGRLVAPHTATAEHHRRGNAEPLQLWPQAPGEQAVGLSRHATLDAVAEVP